ncbi:MAG: hypothetical protein OWQ50_05185 [Acidianus infernus]|nr:hypothetical protein [Acidianus infernus]
MSTQYASYVSPKLGISIGTFASIIRGNISLFTRLYNDLQNGNTADIEAIEQMTSHSSLLSTIVTSLANTPNSMAAPLALTYNGAVALGLLPPAIAQALTNLGANLQNVVIDFGYNARA